VPRGPRTHPLVLLARSTVTRGESATRLGGLGGGSSMAVVAKLSYDHGARAVGSTWHGEGGDGNH
jgi:hypothetical protein